MASYKEIVTKAVIGKAKKTTNGSYLLVPQQTPNTILGCWIINHSFSGINNGSEVTIDGAFDVNVWYSYDNDTKTDVVTKRFNYDDLMNVTIKENSSLSDAQIIVRSLKQPTVVEVKIEAGEVLMNIEKELGVEIVGDTKVKIVVEDEEDEYEVLDNDVTNVVDSDISAIDAEVKEDYIV